MKPQRDRASRKRRMQAQMQKHSQRLEKQAPHPTTETKNPGVFENCGAGTTGLFYTALACYMIAICISFFLSQSAARKLQYACWPLGVS
eukprot:4247417-Amphidinium_carterae.1